MGTSRHRKRTACFSQLVFIDVFGDASDTVAAHLSFGTVRIEYLHPCVCIFRWAYENQTVGTDTEVPVTDGLSQFARIVELLLKAVDIYIVVAQAVHLRESHILSP